MRFSKWHALGNAYLLVERDEIGAELTPDRVRLLCDANYGVGSDGVLEILATRGATAELQIWNPDGTTAELSGNGARIAARWLALRSSADAVRLQIGGRELFARMLEGGDVAVEVGLVEVGAIEPLDIGDERVEFTPVSVGNPHAVVRAEPDRIRLLRLGPAIERHERFPDRTNVQLIRVDGPHELDVLVWERGAGETQSSGTSAVAAVAAAVANGWCESPVTVRLPGGHLRVELDAENRATLTGPAVEILRGELTTL